MFNTAVVSSYQRILTAGNFGDCVYQRFLESHPEVARRFAGVDMARQKFLLQRSLTVMMQHAAGLKGADAALDRIAGQHGPHGMSLPPFLFDYWIDALVGAVAECDPRCDMALEAAWRSLLRREVAHFIARGKQALPLPVG
ncbi:MAG: globin [Nitrospirota bacterium]|nr:globin [Nitrospirota bacterium]